MKKNNFRLMGCAMPVALLAALTTAAVAPAGAQEIVRDDRGPMVVYSVEAGFADASDALKESISEQGLVLSNELHASDMLNRTGPDLGITTEVYQHAATFEFCSSQISHELVAQDPANLMVCPYAIGLYVLTTDPDRVQFAYRRPQGVPGSEQATAKVERLVDRIINGALDFL